MKTIVITGSTRGIGFGLADAFLAQGCNVVVCGRMQVAVDEAVEKLAAKHSPERILGERCDVSDYEHVQSLWDAAKQKFEQVDIWVNNAGLSSALMDFWTIEKERMDTVVGANLLGTMYGSKVAITGMLVQGFGALYNMEGAGSDGRVHAGMTLYGITKRGGRHLVEGLAKELKETPVIVGGLSPGMVVTGLLNEQRERNPEEWENTKRIFNILADKVETVTPWLVERMLENQKNGVNISWTTRSKMMLRFLMAPFRKRDLFADEEN